MFDKNTYQLALADGKRLAFLSSAYPLALMRTFVQPLLFVYCLKIRQLAPLGQGSAFVVVVFAVAA